MILGAGGIRHNIATADPTTGDNYLGSGNLPGYSRGSMWINTTDGGLWICTDPGSAGSANATWVELGGIADGSITAAKLDGGSGASTGDIPKKASDGGFDWVAASSLGGVSAYADLTDVLRTERHETGDTLAVTSTETAFSQPAAAGDYKIDIPAGHLTEKARIRIYAVWEVVANPSARAAYLYVKADDGVNPVASQPIMLYAEHPSPSAGAFVFSYADLIVQVAGASGLVIGLDRVATSSYTRSTGTVDLTAGLTLTASGLTDAGSDLEIRAVRLFAERVA